jgi:hypothetical protein
MTPLRSFVVQTGEFLPGFQKGRTRLVLGPGDGALCTETPIGLDAKRFRKEGMTGTYIRVE